MTINEIKTVLYKQATKYGYTIEERKSSSTGSWYFKIYSGKQSLLFRVADHKTKSTVITLRLDHKINSNIVEKFIKNRCKDLSYRCVKSFLGV